MRGHSFVTRAQWQDSAAALASRAERKGSAAVTAAAIPDERAQQDPHGACIADERQELDNAQFAQTVTGVAALFAAAGLGAGDVLAIMLPNRVELVTSMFAAWRLGAAVTPVNPSLTAREAQYQIDDAAARLIVADDASAQKLRRGGQPIIWVDDVTSPARPKVPVPTTSAPDTLALLIYTSGTTGRPKGVMLDHATSARRWIGSSLGSRCPATLAACWCCRSSTSTGSWPVSCRRSWPAARRSSPSDST